MKIGKLLLTLIAIATLSACGMTKQLKEMHDSTRDMNKTTSHMDGQMGNMNQTMTGMNGQMGDMNKTMGGMDTKLGETNQAMGGMVQSVDKMNQNTEDLKKNTAEVSNVSCQMYSAIRQGDTLSSRRTAMEKINEVEAGAPKISEAGKYFMAFEYQLYSEACVAENHSRELLAADAAKEFMRDVQQFIDPGQTEPMPFANPTLNGEKTANRQQALNALAVAMHILNPKQEATVKKSNLTQFSMWDMVKASLAARKQLEDGTKKISDFPDYVNQILIYDEVAQLLAQTRYNYLGAMMISRASHIREGVVNFAKMRLFSWTLDLSDYGIVEITEFANYLNAANLASDFMKANGLQPKMDNTLKAILGHMKLSDQLKAAAAADPGHAAPRVAAEADFIAKLLKYRQSAGLDNAL
jgi:uncharacterized protein YoxC